LTLKTAGFALWIALFGWLLLGRAEANLLSPELWMRLLLVVFASVAFFSVELSQRSRVRLALLLNIYVVFATVDLALADGALSAGDTRFFLFAPIVVLGILAAARAK
jgi:hypothetical protein